MWIKDNQMVLTHVAIFVLGHVVQQQFDTLGKLKGLFGRVPIVGGFYGGE